jgi:hypothetical protein
MLEPTQVGIDLVTRNASGSDSAGDRLQLAFADQCPNVVLGAAELGGNFANRPGWRPVHALSIAGPLSSGVMPQHRRKRIGPLLASGDADFGVRAREKGS